MPLMDLRRPVPNSGAHRMAWVIGLAPDPAAKLKELEVLLGANMPERLLYGDVTPGSMMTHALWRWSGGKITVRDFYMMTPKRWNERPLGFSRPAKALGQRAA